MSSVMSASMYRAIDLTLRMLVDGDRMTVTVNQPQKGLDISIAIPLLLTPLAAESRLMPIEAVEVTTGVRDASDLLQGTSASTHSCVTFRCPFNDDRCSALHIVVLDNGTVGTSSSVLRHPFVKCLNHALEAGNWKALHDFTIDQAYTGFRLQRGASTVFTSVGEGVFPLPDRSVRSKDHGGAVIGGVSLTGAGSRALLRAVTGCATPRARELQRVGRECMLHTLLWQHLVRYWTAQGSAFSDPEMLRYLSAALH